MKQDVLHSLVPLKKEELRELCREVKETVATDVLINNKEAATKEASFGINDLWSLQKKMKTAGRFWNNRNRNFIIR